MLRPVPNDPHNALLVMPSDRKCTASMFHLLTLSDADLLGATSGKFTRPGLAGYAVARGCSNAYQRYVVGDVELERPILSILHLDVKAVAQNLELAARGEFRFVHRSKILRSTFGASFAMCREPAFAARAWDAVSRMPALSPNDRSLMYGGLYFLAHSDLDESLTLEEAAYRYGADFFDAHTLSKKMFRKLRALYDFLEFEARGKTK